MKKLTKRILCSALSVTMASSLAAEYVLRSSAESFGAVNGSTTSQNVKIENVTGQFDTSKLVESNFNSSVLKNEDVAPKYETRTVIVTLKGETVADLAGKDSVPEYLRSWSGQRAVADISSEQDAFLRKLKKTGIEYKLEKRYDTVLNGVAIEVNTKHVKAIKQIEELNKYYADNAFLVDLTTVDESELDEMIYTTLNVIDSGRISGTVINDNDTIAVSVATIVKNFIKGKGAFDGVASEVKDGEVPTVVIEGSVAWVRFAPARKPRFPFASRTPTVPAILIPPPPSLPPPKPTR